MLTVGRHKVERKPSTREGDATEVSKPPFVLDQSVFAPRKKQCDAKSYWDGLSVFQRAFTIDWSRCSEHRLIGVLRSAGFSAGGGHSKPRRCAVGTKQVAMPAAAFDMVLKKLLSRIERRLMRSSWPVIQKNACRAVITLFQTTLSYSLMLLAMTFDVYVFFSIIVGFSLGVLISGHWNDTGMPSGMTRGSEIRLDELRLAVSGMTCEGCKSAVTRALNSVDGVESVDVDLHSGISTVISTGVPIAALVAAVEATGKGCCVQSEARSFKRVTEEGLQAPFLNTSPECCR